MRVFLLLLGCFTTIVMAVAAGTDKEQSGDEKRWRRLMERPHVRRGVLPKIELQLSATATAEDATQIKRHIANLAKIERPDFGMSGTMGGMAFAPVPGSGLHTG